MRGPAGKCPRCMGGVLFNEGGDRRIEHDILVCINCGHFIAYRQEDVIQEENHMKHKSRNLSHGGMRL